MNRETLRGALGAIALIGILAALWILAGRLQPVDCPGGNPSTSLTVRQAALSVEVAADDDARQCGLAHRDHLPNDHGMLFAYPEARILEFWMKDTRIPLSIAFIDADRRIREIVDMQPGSTERLYRSRDMAKYALETNQGWFEASRVTVGDAVSFTLPAEIQVR